MACRIPKPEHLTEDTTLTTFKKWQNNMLYNLSQNNDFAPYMEPTCEWQKASTTNRGLTSDEQTVDAAQRKTALQKNIILERMLGFVAQYSPDLLNIINKSTSLNWV